MGYAQFTHSKNLCAVCTQWYRSTGRARASALGGRCIRRGLGGLGERAREREGVELYYDSTPHMAGVGGLGEAASAAARLLAVAAERITCAPHDVAVYAFVWQLALYRTAPPPRIAMRWCSRLPQPCPIRLPRVPSERTEHTGECGRALPSLRVARGHPEGACARLSSV